ncbi:MAG: chemotaxis protein CheD [Thermoplasmata archaeon]|nr:chemotaxis protein CheD [Thermoplasmata archaeon]
MSGDIVVEVASYHVAANPTRLMCIGLGSCVAIALYDPIHHLGGLAHAMLPRYQEGRDKTNVGKYVDTSIYLMIDELIALGAKKGSLKAKLVGGAQMFSYLSPGTLDIGTRNVEAARETLKKERVPIVAEDVGGTRGRTMTFDIKTGLIGIQTARKHAKSI